MTDTDKKDFRSLRKKYGEFIYKGYSVTATPEAYHVEYDLEIPGLSQFTAKWDFPVSTAVKSLPEDDAILNELVFALGMVECISYYKIACPPAFKVACMELTDRHRLWWRKLIYNGLGEFMYRNGIEVSEEELVDIICTNDSATVDPTSATGNTAISTSKETAYPLHDGNTYAGCLVPVGGGKDSVVSLELLKGKDIVTYSVNGNDTTRAVIDVCDHKNGDYTAKRVLDKRMIELNSQGYLNGHTPFSAIVAFSSMIAAYILGRKYIVLSNENSANETTVKGSFVNHQYSKSYEFEKDFNGYISGITDSDIHYFSMLRPLSEMQIASLFAGFKKYHKVFRSCNVGSKQGIWCCNCPKCLFVYIILSPFLSEDEMIGIFGEKLLDKESLDKDFRELIGIDENKPFECVGTRREAVSAMRHYRASGNSSLLTDRYADYIDRNGEDIEPLLKEWNDEHLIPGELRDLVFDSL